MHGGAHTALASHLFSRVGLSVRGHPSFSALLGGLPRPELIIGALTVRAYPRRPILHLVNIAVGLASVSFCVWQRSAMHHSEVLGRFFRH